ncbi:hypothetical protein BaRGS_00025710 [Batillaria attramentaria]|uniref:Uncharacterized protein n=1 Tax=Batillaria attramentaria TaxID=370345 RepID=A0ABD0K7S7_9CAEN
MQVAALTTNQEETKSEDMKQEQPQASSSESALEEKDSKQASDKASSSSLDEWRNPGKHASSGPDGGSPKKKPRKSAEKALNEMRKNSAQKPSLKRSASVRMQKSSSVSSLPAEPSAATKPASDQRPVKKHTRGLSAGRVRSNSVDLKSTPETKKDKDTAISKSKMPKMNMNMLAGPSFLK